MNNYGILQEIESEISDEDQQPEELKMELPLNFNNNINNMEEIFLATRINIVLLHAEMGKTYTSKDKKSLWDVEPTVSSRQARTKDRNVLKIRMGHVDCTAKQSKTAVEIIIQEKDTANQQHLPR